MTDIFIGLSFVVMILAPAVIATMQWSRYVTVEPETLPEHYALPGTPPEES